MKLHTPSILAPLAQAPFRRLFTARTLALVGSGLTTLALSLLAYDLAGADAGVVLGTALALKMIAYVTVSPIVGGFADRLPRRALLVAFDLLRAGGVLGFVWVTEAHEIYLLIFLVSACAAGFTPIYQAAIPDLLTDSAEYTKGLVLSRVSYDLEGLLSPAVSTLALLVIGYPVFFALNGAAFVASALLVGATALPDAERSQRPDSLRYNITFGVRSYLATPRLRGLLALCTAVSMAGAMLIVNTVVIVRARLGGSETDVALAFTAAGLGSLLAALVTPAALEKISLRTHVVTGAALLPIALIAGAFAESLGALLAAWLVAGAGMSLVQTPAGRVIEASCNTADRSAYFSAHFSLTHAAWLFAYPLAGWIGAFASLDVAFAMATAGAAIAACVGLRAWPRRDPSELWHTHEELVHSHEHSDDGHHAHEHDAVENGEPHAHPHRHPRTKHRHRFVVDAHHPVWPR